MAQVHPSSLTLVWVVRSSSCVEFQECSHGQGTLAPSIDALEVEERIGERYRRAPEFELVLLRLRLKIWMGSSQNQKATL